MKSYYHLKTINLLCLSSIKNIISLFFILFYLFSTSQLFSQDWTFCWDIYGEAAGDNSGHVVSISSDGTTVAIASPANDGNGVNAGHVRVYRYSGVVWSQLGNDIDGEAAGDFSGTDISISSDGNTVAIGAQHNNGNGFNAGHVRVYRYNGVVWNQLGMDIDGEAPDDFSGHEISISADGNTVAIGATRADGIVVNTGHVRVYRYNGVVWNQLGMDIDGKSQDEIFSTGVSLSSDGNTVAIGARQNFSDPGVTRVYQYNGVVWSQLGNDIDGEAAVDDAGYEVSLSSDGNTVAIGAPGNDGNGNISGSVRVYRYNGAVWNQLGMDIDGEAPNDHLGNSVSLSADGNIVAIGAVDNDGNGVGSGSVRVYTINAAFCDTSLDSLGGEYFTKQMIVQLDTADFPLSARQELRDSFQATVLDTCLCGQLELWELPRDLVLEGVPIIDIQDRVKTVKKKTKVEDAGANYVVNFTDYGANKFQDTNGFTDNNLVDNINTKVRVAVLDSGVDDLSSFSGIFWQSPFNTGPDDENCIDDPAGFDFVNNSSVTLDTVGHGTAVTGRIVNASQGGLIDDPTEFDEAIIDSLEIVNAKVYAGNRGTLWDLLCGLYYARDADVDIVNCSMGYSGEESSVLKTAIRALQDSCILVVASAGNDSLDNDEIPHWPSGFDMDNIVSVAAVNGFNSAKLSTYSNFGEGGVHLAYPGTVGALLPGDSISFKKGTSYSAAAVTGIAARLKMHKPEASYLDLRNALFGGVRISTPRLDVSTGGILDYPTALEVLNTQTASPCICLPMLACREVIVDLSAVQNQQIEANIFNNGSSSNCAAGGLIYSFASDPQQSQTMTISCNDIGNQTLNWYVTDAEGNQDFCQVQLTITDTNSICNNLNGCEGEGNLHVDGIMENGDYKAMNILTSDGKVSSGAVVNFISAGSITLQAGFEAQANSNFQASISGVACEELIETPPNTSRNQLSNELLAPSITIQVVPNPFSGRTTIQYELPASTNQLYMAIFDISGKKLKELHRSNPIAKGIYTIELDASNWERGMYFLGVRTENQTITKKLVLLGSY